MSKIYNSLLDSFLKKNDKKKDIMNEWIEHESNLGELQPQIVRSFGAQGIRDAVSGQTLQVLPGVLPGVLKNSDGKNNKDLMQQKMRINRNMKTSEPIVPINNPNGKIHHERKASTTNPDVIKRYKSLNNQTIITDH